jgi:hypothetical protein
MAYELPPTDPRVLDADEGTILRDLLARMYHTHAQRKLYDPKGAAAAEAEGTADEGLREQYKALEQDATRGELATRIRAFEQARTAKPGGRRLAGIRLKVTSAKRRAEDEAKAKADAMTDRLEKLRKHRGK